MHPHFVPIDGELLRTLYEREGFTIEKIAEQLRCGASTIRRRLRRFGIPVRPHGPRPLPERLQRAPPAWSPAMAYVIGLMTTDGNLTRVRYGLSLSSKDVDLLETARRCLGIQNTITPYTDSQCYHVQWRDRRLYTWLLAIGLTPAKSLTLGPLRVPAEYFADFFRGCIDGDGTVRVYTDRYHAVRNANYVYERLYVSLVSGSRAFLDWVRSQVRRLLGVNGALSPRSKARPLDVDAALRQSGIHPLDRLDVLRA